MADESEYFSLEYKYQWSLENKEALTLDEYLSKVGYPLIFVASLRPSRRVLTYNLCLKR